jgi:hypothetical protein
MPVPALPAAPLPAVPVGCEGALLQPMAQAIATDNARHRANDRVVAETVTANEATS